MANYDMDPDAVAQSINRLRAAGDEFADAWQRRKQALQGHRSGIGSDEMAQAFLERYVPLLEQLTTRADGISGTYGTLCDDIHGCIADYRAADTRGTGSVNGLTATDGSDPLE